MLVLLCHPETVMQAATLWLSNSSSLLSEVGRNVAEDLASHDRVQNDRAYVAPQDHVQEFARMVLSGPFEPVEEFTDRSMGSLSGRSYRETLAEFPRRNWLAWQRSYWNAPPDGESLFDISERVLDNFRSKVLPIESNETVVVIAGADVIRILIGYLSRVEEAEVPKIQIEPGLPYVVHGNLGV